MTQAGRTGMRLGWPVAASVSFLVLTLLVATGATESFDMAARDLFRPGDRWGAWQISTDYVVELLQPVSMFVLLGVVGLWVAAQSKSLRPLLIVASVSVSAVGTTLLVKFALARPDPHLELSTVGGAYPSGHVVAVLACLGAIVLVFDQARSRWVWVLVATVGAVMSSSLLLAAAHWFSDVLGGALVAAAVLGWANRLLLRPEAEAFFGTTASQTSDGGLR